MFGRKVVKGGKVEGELEVAEEHSMINFRVIHSMVVQPTYSINMQGLLVFPQRTLERVQMGGKYLYLHTIKTQK